MSETPTATAFKLGGTGMSDTTTPRDAAMRYESGLTAYWAEKKQNVTMLSQEPAGRWWVRLHIDDGYTFALAEELTTSRSEWDIAWERQRASHGITDAMVEAACQAYNDYNENEIPARPGAKTYEHEWHEAMRHALEAAFAARGATGSAGEE